MKRILIALIVSLATSTIAVEPILTFKEKTFEQLSNKEISEDWGKVALGISSSKKWQHGESEHFVIHFFRSGEKIARRSELFYSEIKEFFGNRPDLLKGRKSHLFAFADGQDWNKFKTTIELPYIGGVTRGNEFFYLATGEEGQFDSKARVQAHEMTHLVFNRFFTGHPPLWLNEGVAEYFGQRKTSSINEFRRRMGRTEPFDLDTLLASERYPTAESDMLAFYAEAAIVVDFLTKDADRRALLPKFVDAMIADKDVSRALQLYGYASLADFKKAYSRYRQRFQ